MGRNLTTAGININIRDEIIKLLDTQKTTYRNITDFLNDASRRLLKEEWDRIEGVRKIKDHVELKRDTFTVRREEKEFCDTTHQEISKDRDKRSQNSILTLHNTNEEE